jgi:hypothetical protein
MRGERLDFRRYCKVLEIIGPIVHVWGCVNRPLHLQSIVFIMDYNPEGYSSLYSGLHQTARKIQNLVLVYKTASSLTYHVTKDSQHLLNRATPCNSLYFKILIRRHRT